MQRWFFSVTNTVIFMLVTVIYYCYFCNTLHKTRQHENSLESLYLLGFLLYDKTRQHYTKSKLRGCILIPTMKSIGGVKAENGVSSKEVSTPNSEPEKIDFSKVKVEPLFEEDVDFDTFSKSDFRAVKVKECVAVPKSKKLLQFTLDDGTGTDRTILSGIHAYYEPEELVGKTLIAITNLPPRAMMGIDSCGMLLSAVHEEEGEEKLHLLMVDEHIPAGAKLY
jgi:methionine--tRNA ligase beta chain